MPAATISSVYDLSTVRHRIRQQGRILIRLESMEGRLPTESGQGNGTPPSPGLPVGAIAFRYDEGCSDNAAFGPPVTDLFTNAPYPQATVTLQKKYWRRSRIREKISRPKTVIRAISFSPPKAGICRHRSV